MILTGKAKIRFINWYAETNSIDIYVKDFSLNIAKTITYALITEWLDSEGFYINIKSKFGQRKQCERFSFNIKTHNSGFMFNTRNEALEKAIGIANSFYNQSYSKAIS